MFTKKAFKDDDDKRFEEFLSSDFSKTSINNFIDSDIANKKEKAKAKVKNFWNDDDDSSSSMKIGTGKSFLKSTPARIVTPADSIKDGISEIPIKNYDESESQYSDLRLNLNQSSDKSQASNNIYEEPMKNNDFVHPITFEGVTDNMFEHSYSPTLIGESKVKDHKQINGIETIKSNVTSLPIDKSFDNIHQSLDRTDKEHLLSKVSLVDSYDGHKQDKSFVKHDDLNSTGGFEFDYPKIDNSGDMYYRNSVNPASGDSYNNTQGITNVTDTVIGDTTAADLAAIHKQYEKYINKDSADLSPDTNFPMSETLKEIYEDKSNHFDDMSGHNLESTINSKSFGLKVIRQEEPISNASPTPTPRPRNKHKLSESDNMEISMRNDIPVISPPNRQSESEDKSRPSRYSHVKSSGYGSKSITGTNKNPNQISSKSQPNSSRGKGNQPIQNSLNKISHQTFVKSEPHQSTSKSHNRSKSVPRSNESENSFRMPLQNKTYVNKKPEEEHNEIMYRNQFIDSFERKSKEWQDKWLEERKLVKKLQADSTIQERDFKRQNENVTQKYEEKISQLESQLNRMKQQLQSRPDFNNKLLGPTVTQEDIVRIEREMREQSSILAAYEKDNERLCQEIKILKQHKKGEDKIDSIENERLISQFVSLKAELDSKDIELRNLKQITKENRLLKNMGNVDNNDFYLHQISDLKNELNNLNKRYLQSESDKQRAEMKLDKIIVETEKQVSQFQHELSIQKIEREKLIESHKVEVDDLKRKIKWYLENQALLDQTSKKLKAKDNEMVELKQQLELASTVKISSNIRAKEKIAESTKIKRLEEEIMSLKEDLYSLVKGKNIGNVAEKRTVQFLEEKIKSLEADNDKICNKENNALRSLQQQFEAMKFQYEEKINDLELDLMQKIDSKTQPEKHTRINDLRSKIDELNNESQKKSSLINRLKADLKKVNKASAENLNQDKKSKNIRKFELDNRSEMLRNELHEKDIEIQRLKIQNDYLKNDALIEYNRDLPYQTLGQVGLEAENAKCKSQIIHLTRDLENYKQALDEIKHSVIQNEQLIRDECGREIDKIEEFHKENLNNVKMDYANRHSQSDLANLQSQIDMQKNYINHLQDQISDSTIKLRECDSKSSELATAREQIQLLKTELSDLRLIWAKKPGLEMIDRLRSKIIQLEEKENLKGRQLDEYVDKMVKNNIKQYQDEVERWRSIVAKKNHNLLSVQQELNHLLEALEELKRQGITVPKFSDKSRMIDKILK